MASTEKEWVVKQLEKNFKSPDFLIFTGYKGLKAEELTELRKNLDKTNSRLRVIKNTLAKLGAKKAKREEILPFLDGPVAVVSTDKENISMAKLLVSFARAHPFLTLKGGMLNESILGAQEIGNLARLPSREILLAQVKNGFLAPLSGLVFSLKGLMQGLIGVLKNIEKQKA